MATKKETAEKTATKKATKKVVKKIVETAEAQNESQNLKDTIMSQNLAGLDVNVDVTTLSINDTAEVYDKMISDYAESVKDMNLEQLAEEEKKIMEQQDVWDKNVRGKIYKLAANINWKNKEVTRAQIGAKIRAILDKLEFEYKYTLGMYQMASWWAAPKAEIDFSTLNSTLQVLGNPAIKYKGPHEWENILIIDEYFKSCNTEYTKDTLLTYMWAGRHNTIINKMDEVKKLNSPVAPQGDNDGEQGPIMPAEVAEQL